ncbi:MAG: DUF2339 domain-containing protein, partial [Pseudomonadota bacterium]|nr:DUF2339 domain-containing protein [Pseudomonadota bacterium]
AASAVPPPIPAAARPTAEAVFAEASPQPVRPPAPNFIDTALARVKRWFTEGNVPVKVGMLVSLAGVAALLKYATDQGWLNMPIEYRLAGVALAALAALVFGWRQRIARPDFALAVQGGGIGILLLTIFAASKIYGLLPVGLAFVLSVIMIAGAGVLAVLQNSRTLAVLSVLAGFMAPIWLSDGGGNHVALFSYYALLNLAVFAVVWFKPWRVLMLLGFVFTWGVGIAWGVLGYKPHLFASTQPFLVLFFVLYLLMPLLHARRLPPQRQDLISGGMLFGTPLIAFSLQAGLLPDQPMLLALIAVGMAAVYTALAWWLRGRAQYAVFADSYPLLALGFATLAVPLAFSAQVTGAVFALEGAALVWYGLRRQRWLPQGIGVALQLAAAVAYFVALGERMATKAVHVVGDMGRELAGLPARVSVSEWPILNGIAMSGLLIAIAGFATAWMLRRHKLIPAAGTAYLWAMAWWLGIAINEITRFAAERDVANWVFMLAAFTGWLAAEVARRRPDVLLNITAMAGLLIALPMAIAQGFNTSMFEGIGGIAWLAYAVLGVRSLVCLRQVDGGVSNAAQVVWWWVWPCVAMALAATWLARSSLGQAWHFVALYLPWLVMLALALRWPRVLMMPLGERFRRMVPWLGASYLLVVAAGFVISLFMAGDPRPLPWLPLLNPLALMQIAAVLLTVYWLRESEQAKQFIAHRGIVAGVVGLVWITSATLRGVHHLAGVPWHSTMFSIPLTQTSLTLLWSILGVAGWVIGSRRGLRTVWLAGAVLMAVVLAKLVLVDRQHLGNLLGIGSFIAYGLLCTVVGYFAPAPPKAAAANTQEATS